MNIDINQLFQDLTSNLNTKQGGHLRPRDFNNWVNQISLQLFKEKFALYANNQIVIDEITRPFLKSETITTKKTTQNYCLLEFPSDYAFYSSITVFKDDGKVVECPKPGEKQESILANLCSVAGKLVSDFEWGSVCTHALMPPTLDRVFLCEYGKGFMVTPKEVGFVNLNYFRYPLKAELVFKAPFQDQNPDLTATKPLEWSDTTRNEFLNRLKIFYAGFTREPFLDQTGVRDKETTL